MVSIIDTHAHLYVDEFKDDREEMIRRALDSGIQKMYLPNIDVESIPKMLKLEKEFPGVCIAMLGLHPCHVGEDYESQLDVMESMWTGRDFAAVGEIGLDLYWDKDSIEIQKIAFLRQVRFAVERDKPIVIHSRDATREVIDLLSDHFPGHLFRGVFHCFSGTIGEAKEIMSLGMFLGIGGVVTFKNGGLDRVVKDLPLERLVLETDAPYLAPAPHRGKRNESSFIPLIINRISELKGVSFDTVASVTTRNAEELFR